MRTDIRFIDASPALLLEIRASYELGRRLGGGEVTGKLQMSWHELLGHGNEPFGLSFPPVRGVHPFLTLKVAVVRVCDNHNCSLFCTARLLETQMRAARDLPDT